MLSLLLPVGAQHLPVEERRILEGEIVRKCLARSDKQCSFVEHRHYKVCLCVRKRHAHR